MPIETNSDAEMQMPEKQEGKKLVLIQSVRIWNMSVRFLKKYTVPINIHIPSNIRKVETGLRVVNILHNFFFFQYSNIG